MKRLLFSMAILFGFGTLKAQVPADALRFSAYEVLGTARNVGIGGGIGALGADFSVLSTNPAGLASYRRSEFTVTPSLYLDNTEATLDGSNPNVQKNKFAFNLNNLGFVFSRQGRNPNWRTTNLGIGINRIANFQTKFDVSGRDDRILYRFFSRSFYKHST